MKDDTNMTDDPPQRSYADKNTPSVLVWAGEPIPGFDEEMEEDDEGPQPTIMFVSPYSAEALSDDAHSQRVAENLLNLQAESDRERLTISELTERTKNVIDALEGQSPVGNYRWAMTDEKIADIWINRGLSPMCLRSIARDEFLDGLLGLPTGTEVDKDGGSGALTRAMSGMQLGAQ
jgi:hypothetical protein